ncbi:hypothetical protein GALMADRAFT_251523 [Galerina marginata CBS 339.88]|uniref:Fanconi-associated nuclease n=1 Tax=Galerina marginata (strain CBS 339.88) TaxID=685588 RepID=A0A067SRX7_GALM3|nr:hypothetical protein GALMADRAFT_251523 [Galerina marginata CBS 339.88]
MALSGTTTSRKLIQQLIFGGSLVDEEAIEQDLENVDEGRNQQAGPRRPSAYVEVFENTAKIVIERESRLLSESEINVLEKFGLLCYNTRYCLVRLVLRKANQWHAVSALNKYEKEIGKEGLLSSIADLCRPIHTIVKEELPDNHSIKMEPPEPRFSSINDETEDTRVAVKVEDEPEVIDLTMDTDEEEIKPDLASLMPNTATNCWAPETSTSEQPEQVDPIKTVLQSEKDEVNLEFFCEDETVMTLDEILWRLNKDQLMVLVKATKCKLKPAQSKKSDIICCLQHTAANQSILDFGSVQNRKVKGKARDDGLRQTALPFAPVSRPSLSGKAKVTQEKRLKQMALQVLGKCIRVNFDFFRLVRRLHIICYRETEHPTALLLPALLTVFKKRDYTRYEYVRSDSIWSSREELLDYEAALELEKLLDELIEGSDDKQERTGTKTPARQFVTPMTSGTSRLYTTPLRTPASASNIRSSQTPGVKKEEELFVQDLGEEDEFEGSVIVEIKKEEQIKKHLEEWILPRWQELVARQHARGEITIRPPGLERFDSGYIHTRMVHKASRALGTLKEYRAELKVLETLLAQRFWRRGKRAAWYERRAVVLGHLTSQAHSADEKRSLLLQNMEGIKEALLDDDTGIVSRPGLVKRLMTLEKRLKVPLEERSICEGELRMAVTIELRAIKLDPLKFDALGRPVGEKENKDIGIHAYISIAKAVDSKPEPALSKKKLGKSRWKGRDGEVVNVEMRALESYEDQGFTGFHCETKILTTIFGLLFWDIIFATVPGAFETPFQVAPLDMFEESFYRARKDLIDKRLEEISNDGWREILQKHDDAYRKDKTWCIGVSWDLCSKEDLFDIFECIGKESLAIICQLFCEDYKGRSSGGPDLFVWNAKKGTCKFVEVKGPGDRPQENQKYWFDSLLRAKVDIEICKVIDDSAPVTVIASSKKRKAKTPSAAHRQKKNAPTNSPPEEEDYDRLDPEHDGGGDSLALQPPDPPSSRKRRRVSTPDCKSAYSEAMDNFPFATASSSSDVASSPTRLISRPNRVEVVLTLSQQKS